MNSVQSSEMMGKGPPSSPPGSPAEGRLVGKAPGFSSSLLTMELLGKAPQHVDTLFPHLPLGPCDHFSAIPKKGDDLGAPGDSVG